MEIWFVGLLRAAWVAAIFPILVASIPSPRLQPFHETLLLFSGRGKTLKTSSRTSSPFMPRYFPPSRGFSRFSRFSLDDIGDSPVVFFVAPFLLLLHLLRLRSSLPFFPFVVGCLLATKQWPKGGHKPWNSSSSVRPGQQSKQPNKDNAREGICNPSSSFGSCLKIKEGDLQAEKSLVTFLLDEGGEVKIPSSSSIYKQN